MSSKKRVNKTFEESCRLDHLFIDQNDGTHWCISKESPKSRKFDKTVCQLVACPNYISKEIESLSKKEKKIRGYIEKGKSIEFIVKNTPCSRSWYFEVKKRMDEDKKTLEKEQVESDEELKALQKIEPIPPHEIYTKKPLPVSATHARAPARNLVYSKLDKRPIKLMLDKHKHYQTAIRYALDNSHRWTPYNLQEIRERMEKEELNLNPVPVEYMRERDPFNAPTKDSYKSIGQRQYLYSVLRTGWKTGLEYYNNVKIHKLDIKYRTPKLSIWIEKRLYLWEISHKLRGLKTAGQEKEGLTTEEWYQKMELPFPQNQEIERDWFIRSREELERSGILRDIEYKIKTELGIADEIEKMCETPTEELTTTDIWHMKNLLRENPHHPYSDELKDKIQELR